MARTQAGNQHVVRDEAREAPEPMIRNLAKEQCTVTRGCKAGEECFKNLSHILQMGHEDLDYSDWITMVLFTLCRC